MTGACNQFIRRKTVLLLAICSFLAPFESWARDRIKRTEFVREHPCPSTGKTHGACPGWVVDHVIPLCAGGADDPNNMQWQEKKESLEKDKDERRECRELRRSSR